ncbi:sulfite exporter TauE/SafE family protein [Flexithrix dorotheae]|uniref:urease accessory protein UreH domain-containing protein n=1 Tax=Flexithrix dorotheae TaxID=70993 RepID=UPI000370FDF3|nr:sulfite exporter TauE/SafE family protein [Flexithrix dorotheae]
MFFQLFGLLTTGFFLGIQHSFDADHVAAVSTIATKNKNLRKSAMVGAYWGFGHSLSLLAIGVLVLVFKITLPDIISQYFDVAVGVLLVYLGLAMLRSYYLKKDQSVMPGEANPRHQHIHKSFFIGILHGLAGSAAVMLLVLSSIDSMMDGLLFLLCFGVGTILGMMVSGTIIGYSFLLTQRYKRFGNAYLIIIALISIGIGVHVIRENWVF